MEKIMLHKPVRNCLVAIIHIFQSNEEICELYLLLHLATNVQTLCSKLVLRFQALIAHAFFD